MRIIRKISEQGIVLERTNDDVRTDRFYAERAGAEVEMASLDWAGWTVERLQQAQEEVWTWGPRRIAVTVVAIAVAER